MYECGMGVLIGDLRLGFIIGGKSRSGRLSLRSGRLILVFGFESQDGSSFLFFLGLFWTGKVGSIGLLMFKSLILIEHNLAQFGVDRFL